MSNNNLSVKSEISYFGPIFIGRNCIELPVNVTGNNHNDEDNSKDPRSESLSNPIFELSKLQPPKKHRTLSPKRFFQHIGRGMALIRNDDCEDRNQQGKPDTTDKGDQTRNTQKLNGSTSESTQAHELVVLRDLTATAREGGADNESKSDSIEHKDNVFGKPSEKTTTMFGLNVEQNFRTRVTKNTDLLKGSSSAFEMNPDHRENVDRVMEAKNPTTTVSDKIHGQKRDLEEAKDKVFGKKRILKEILCNAYSMECTVTVDKGNVHRGQQAGVIDTSSKTYFQKQPMTTLNGFAGPKGNVAPVNYTKARREVGNEWEAIKYQEEENLSNNFSQTSIMGEVKDMKNPSGCSSPNQNNAGFTFTEQKTNGVHKTFKPDDIEAKVHKYIDETNGTDNMCNFDDSVKSGYEEMAKLSYSSESINVDIENLSCTNMRKLTSTGKGESGAQRQMLKQDKGKKMRKEYFATESRAALRQTANSNPNMLHRRYASDGLLDRNLKNLFQDTNWRPLSADFDSYGYIAVVAIDFGTTYSGYAYCFTSHPDVIYMMRKPEGGDPGIYNQKTPTTILLTPEEKFHSFGYTARDYFHDLDPKEASSWLYFEHFKMMLHTNENITVDSKLVSENGKEVSALKVFSYGLAYFKDHSLRELSDQSGRRITSDQIKWVITVPAIWKASAKQFMRQAAYNAGVVSPVNSDQLLIALEPEAASMYCLRQRLLHPATLVGSDTNDCNHSNSATLHHSNDSLFSGDIDVGAQYMIVDCGGGTTDITVHQIDGGGRLRETHKAVGGPFGSLEVDREFELLLQAIFGKDTIETFKIKRPAGWVDLMTAFESRKRGAGPYRTTHTTVSFPFSFIDFFKKRKGHGIESAVKKYGNKDISVTSSGMLRMSPDVMQRLFHITINKIKQEIGTVLNHPDTRGISHLVLVGGFAESSVLQHEIRKEFGHILKIIIPQGVGTITAKGAVLYGLNPDIIIERRSRLTYGVGVLRRFNPEKHPPSKKVIKDGIEWCSDILDCFVSSDQPVGLGETVVRSYTPVRKCQTSTVINIYSTDRKDALFITDKGVKHCGTLCLSLIVDSADQSRGTDGFQLQSTNEHTVRREIRASMSFGDTEIKVTAVDTKTGRTVHSNIDFLNA